MIVRAEPYSNFEIAPCVDHGGIVKAYDTEQEACEAAEPRRAGDNITYEAFWTVYGSSEQHLTATLFHRRTELEALEELSRIAALNIPIKEPGIRHRVSVREMINATV